MKRKYTVMYIVLITITLMLIGACDFSPLQESTEEKITLNLFGYGVDAILLKERLQRQFPNVVFKYYIIYFFHMPNTQLPSRISPYDHASHDSGWSQYPRSMYGQLQAVLDLLIDDEIEVDQAIELIEKGLHDYFELNKAIPLG